jgi:thioredoxin reductase
MKHYQLIVIGGGAAGLGAAITAKQNGVDSILLIEKNDYLGGILNQCIHAGFGLNEFKEELTGPEYADRFIKQFLYLKIEYLVSTMVTKIHKEKVLEYSNRDGAEEVSFDSLIMATGCYERNAGAIKLNGDRCPGIFTAGQAQNYLNNYGYLPGKEVFILGSGDIGLIMARRLTLEGAHVIGVAEIMPYSNGLSRNVVQCLNDFNIPLHLSTTVLNVKGKERLEEITIAKVDDKLNFIPGTEEVIKCDTLLLSVGLIPNISLLKPLGLEMTHTGKVDVFENLESSMEGVFACGNCLHVHDLVDNVTKESRTAGLSAAKYILGKEEEGKLIHVNYSKDFLYVLPEKIRINSDSCELKFRPRAHLNNVKFVVKQGENIIFTRVLPFILPSQMEIIKVPLANVNDDISVEIAK